MEFNWNSDDVKESPEDNKFAPVPAGKYKLKVADTQIKPTKAGDGQLVAVQFIIMDGHFAGRNIFTNYNIKNPNAVAQRIGAAGFKAFLAAINAPGKFTNDDDYYRAANGKIVYANVKIRTGKDGMSRNEIAGYGVPTGTSRAEVKSSTPALDDQIPF